MKISVPFLLLSVLAVSGQETNTTAGETIPIAAPTLPAGSNPQVTPKPETQPGTIGPTTAVLDDQFGETAAPAPTPAASDQDARAPTVQMGTTVGLAGVAAAAALL